MHQYCRPRGITISLNEYPHSLFIAMSGMNCVYCSSRPMRISAATQKKNTGVSQQYGSTRAYTPSLQSVPVGSDINNTTVFVGNLDLNATEDSMGCILLAMLKL
ncbi:hypothetical protein QQ045_016746 [Rhodiola kirilowii]